MNDGINIPTTTDNACWEIGYQDGEAGEFPGSGKEKEYYEGFGAGRRTLMAHSKQREKHREVEVPQPKEVEPPRVLLADAALADLERVSQLLDLLGDRLQGDARSEALIYFALEGLGYIGATLETLLTGVAEGSDDER